MLSALTSLTGGGGLSAGGGPSNATGGAASTGNVTVGGFNVPQYPAGMLNNGNPITGFVTATNNNPFLLPLSIVGFGLAIFMIKKVKK